MAADSPETTRLPAEMFHPSVFIQEEMDARGWDRDMLALKMGPAFGRNRLVLDIYFEVGPTNLNMLLGQRLATQIGQAFGVSPEMLLNLHAAWARGVQAND